MRTLEGREAAKKELKIPLFFWIKNVVLLLAFMVFVVFWIIQPTGNAMYMLHWGIWFPLTSYVIFFEGKRYFKAYPNLFKGIMNVDTLIAIGSHITYIFSVTMTIITIVNNNGDLKTFYHHAMWEVPGVLFISTNIGHALEDNMKNSAVDSYNALAEMTQVQVSKIKGDGSIETLSVRDLKIGDIIQIKKGDLVPIDGFLLDDFGKFDYSNITGESKKIDIKKGELILSGSFNVGDVLKLKVSTNPSESTINKIIDKIEEASSNKPKLQLIADKILKYFLPIGLTIAIVTTIVWLILGYTVGSDYGWLPKSLHMMDPLQRALMAGVTVLVMACPCALGVATPLIMVVTVSHTLEKGVMLNEPSSMEALSGIKYMAFDKTGTITTSELSIYKMHGDLSLINIAKKLEADIHHPIAKAILKAESDKTEFNITNIETADHKGVQGKWLDKKVLIAAYDNETNEYELQDSLTHVALYVDGQAKLIFELENVIKENVKETLAKLKKMGITTMMITGDNEKVANHIASRIGIDIVFAKATPESKANIIKEYQAKGRIAFVGDGFNDSVAIKTADVSMAFATGSDITSNIADISINNENFEVISFLLKIAKVNNKNILLSIGWAMVFNAIAIPIATLNLIQPWMGALTMALSSIMVVGNTYRYKKKYSNKNIL